MAELSSKLDDLYKKKAEGAFIRSRKKWLEVGNIDIIFFNLEKRNFVCNTISKLNINGVITDDHKIISQYCSEFYKNLYTSSYSQVSADNFFNSLQIKPINRTEKELCDRPVTICELMEAINHLKNYKSPGTDGLTSEFYKYFPRNWLIFF